MLSAEYLITVFLVFVRIGACFLAAPFFGHQTVPVRLRVLLSIILAYALAGLVRDVSPAVWPAGLEANTLALVEATALETLTGLCIGLAAQFMFWVVQVGAEIFGFQMGLGLGAVYNPIEGFSSNPVGRFMSLSLLLMFVLVDGPEQLVTALAVSFQTVPLAGARLAAGGLEMALWATEMFETAIRIAAPFMVSFFLIEATLGVFARAVPQADLFSLGLPLKLLVGLALAWVFMQSIIPALPALITTWMDHVRGLVILLAG